MTNKLFLVLTLLSALGCGLIGGVFFAFSTFVMKALAALSPPQGIAAMKSINIAVLNPMFLGVFLGTGCGLYHFGYLLSARLAQTGRRIGACWRCPLSSRNASGDDHLQRSAQ